MEAIQQEELRAKWKALTASMAVQFGDEPDLQTIIFLIGVQELGRGHNNFSKDEKQDLMHLATCRLLSQYGYYEFTGLDSDGWPHYKLVKGLPAMTLRDQDILLKQAVVHYFEKRDIT
jgi:hypothetical protein